MTRKQFDRLFSIAELRVKMLQTTFAGAREKENSDMYKKKMRQIDFIEKFKNHKIILK